MRAIEVSETRSKGSCSSELVLESFGRGKNAGGRNPGDSAGKLRRQDTYFELDRWWFQF